jgi:hypothetical protein
MRLSLLFVIGSAICASVAYPASISTASVTTSSIFNSCSMTSSGALVSCDSSEGVGGLEAFGSASSSASFGSASVFAETAGEGGQADARATASFDEFLIVNGAAPGTIVGHYVYSASFTADFNTSADLVMFISVQQGTTSFTFPLPSSNPASVNDMPIDIQSTFQLVAPFEEQAVLSALGSSPGVESDSASLQFLGFTDLAGNPVAFSIAPEPNTASIVVFGGVMLVGMAGVRTIRRLNHHVVISPNAAL